MAGSNRRVRVVTWGAVTGALLLAAGGMAVVVGQLWYGERPLRTFSVTLTAFLRSSGADTVAVGSVRQRLRQGITVDSLRFVYPLAGGVHFLEVAMAQAKLNWRPWSALRARGRLRLIAGEVAGSGKAWHAVLAAADSAWVREAVQEIRADGINISLRSTRGIVMSTRASVFRMRPEPAEDVWSLEMAGDSVRAFDVAMTGVRAAGVLRHGVLTIDSIAGTVLSGRVEGRGKVTLVPLRVDTAVIAVRSARFTACEDNRAGAGCLRFEDGLDATLAFSSGALDSGEAWVSLRARKVTAERAAVLATFSRLLRTEALTQCTFDSVYGTGTLQREGIRVKRLVCDGAVMRLAVEGWVGRDGRMRLGVDGRVSASLMKSLDPAIRQSLIPGTGRSGQFRCSVRGTPEYPVISLDQQVVERALQSVFDELRNDLMR